MDTTPIRKRILLKIEELLTHDLELGKPSKMMVFDKCHDRFMDLRALVIDSNPWIAGRYIMEDSKPATMQAEIADRQVRIIKESAD